MYWILLFIISWLAASISGAAGFGGALILLPLLTNVVGVKAAVPLLTIAQLFGNISRVWFGRTEIRWKPVGYFVLGAIPASVVGSRVFIDLPRENITTGIGVLLILIVIMRRLKITKFELSDKWLLPGGGIVGFLSAVVGSAGPLGAAFFLGLNLPAVAYVASEAVTAVAMHLAKIIVYQKYKLIGFQEMGFGIFLGIAMILGSWTGKRVIERLPREKFILLVEVLLVVSAVQLILMKF